jgi:acyl carrier protein
VPEQPVSTALAPEFENVLRTCLGDLVSPDTPLREDSDLSTLGIDSVTVVRLLVAVEDTFGVTIPDEAIRFETFSSPGALWTVVSGLLEAQDGR